MMITMSETDSSDSTRRNSTHLTVNWLVSVIVILSEHDQWYQLFYRAINSHLWYTAVRYVPNALDLLDFQSDLHVNVMDVVHVCQSYRV